MANSQDDSSQYNNQYDIRDVQSGPVQNTFAPNSQQFYKHQQSQNDNFSSHQSQQQFQNTNHFANYSLNNPNINSGGQRYPKNNQSTSEKKA